MPETPGKLLKNKREELGLTFTDVSKNTLIRISILLALENDDPDAFSSNAQLRGFLRNYARYLDLDLDLTLPQIYVPETEAIITPVNEMSGMKTPLPEDKSQEISNNSPEPSADQTQNIIIQPEEVLPSLSNSTASQIIFCQIGETLAERRNLLSFSHESVSQMIHIKEEYLQAMEDGNLNIFPSPIQFKGTLQNYAQFLGIDTDRLMNMFAEGLQKRREEQNEQEIGPKRIAKKTPPAILTLRKLFTADLLFGAVLIIGILVFLIWGTSRMVKTSQQTSGVPTLPAVADVLNATTMSDSVLNRTQENGVSTEALPETRTTNTLILPVEIYNSPIQVLVIFNQSVWIRVISDGNNSFEGRVDTGDAKTFTAEQTLYLTSANAAGIQVYFKGTDLGALGPLGRVITLAFDINGLIQATPTPTSAPTTTPQVTPTSEFNNSKPLAIKR